MATKARIFRAPKGKDRLYFSMRCDTAQDKALSWEARGMLAYFLSLRDGWELTVDDLMQQCGRDKAYRIVKELREARYMERERIRKADGTFTWGDYKVHEMPYTENQDMASPLPENAEMDAGEPLPEKPDTEKPESNTHNTSNHKDQNTQQPPSQESPEPKPQPSDPVGAEPSGDGQRGEDDNDPVKEDARGYHGYSAGDLVWVWSDKRRDHVQCTVTRETPAFVWFSYQGITHEMRRKPDRVYREKPKFETFEDLTERQQVVAKWVRNVKPGEGIPGDTKTLINTVLKRVEERFGTNGNAPDASELDRAWTWYTRDGIQCKDPDKVPGMVNDYRDSLSASHHRVMAPATAPAPHELADPNCPVCYGNGVVKSNGAIVACECRTRKAVAS